MPLTLNGVWYADDYTAYSAAGISATEASNLDTFFANRERFDYVWVNASERGAQTGMAQGSRGYQTDSKSEYVYDSNAWRLQLSYAEFTATASTPSGTLTFSGNLTLDGSKSTNSTFVVPAGNGILKIVDPGIYAISTVSNTVGVIGASGRSFLDLSLVASAGDTQRVSINVGEDRGSLSAPSVRITAPNQLVYFQHFFTAGATVNMNTSVRIARIG